jgi:N-ethylmaleimide reductase
MLLITPGKVGALTVPNRVFMAPLTRTRADAHNVPGELMARHYAQRASAGLLIAEATMVSSDAQAWPHQPGIHTAAHAAGWRTVTDAVHAAGGRIILQIWHPGRATHPLLNDGSQPVSSTDRAISDGEVRTPQGKQPYPAPRRLETSEVPRYVEFFRQAALHAKDAGFDGVQIHGAHGYLVDQFLRDGMNDRTDRYGGSIENRARFLLEVLDAVCPVWGPDRVGVRLSPCVGSGDTRDSDPAALVAHVAAEAEKRALGHLELRHGNPEEAHEEALARIVRKHYRGALLRNGGFTRASAERALAQGLADAIVFGTAFLANPDLPRRLLLDAPLNAPNPAGFYAKDSTGYTDYPALPE